MSAPSGLAKTSALDGVPRGGNSSLYNGYATFILALVALLATMDRNIMSILLVPIQKDLGASDTAMGALTGTAFAVVYATAALPLGRLADRTNRRNLLAGAVAVWSAATALCGAAGSYVQLLAARMGVAAGEAGAGPATMSMIGDLYPSHRRGIAIAWISVGSAIGISLGAFVAGALADLYHWKVAFLASGIPGILLAAILWFSMSEPERGIQDGGRRDDSDNATVWRCIAYLASIPTMRWMLVAKILMNAAYAGWLIWVPAFFMRVHGMTTTEMSAWFGGIVGVSAIVSMIIGGLASDRLARRGERWRVYYICLALAAGLPLVSLSCFVSDTTTAWVLIFFYSLITGGVTGVSIAAGLSIVRPTMRAFMSAVMGVCISAIAGGAGPLLIGAINDWLTVSLGNEALRYTLMTSPALLALAILAFYRASATMDEDVERARS